MIDDIEVAALNLLRASAAVSARLDDRIYPDVLPENVVYPAASIQLVTARRITAPLLAPADPGAVDTTLQITAWSNTKKDAKATSRLIRQAIQRWRGTIDGFEIWDITVSLEGPNFYDADLKLFAASIDYVFSHPE